MSDRVTWCEEWGSSLLELLVSLMILVLAVAVVLPFAPSWIDEARLTAASCRMTLLFRQLRQQAIAGDACRAVVFGPPPDAATQVFVVAEDGNDNGIRRAEVEDGTDPVVAGPWRLADEHGGVHFGILDTGAVPVLPPGSGHLTNPADPIRFPSDLVSFTPLGSSSSGTLYLLSPRGRMRAVSLYGVTGRIRVWDYLPARGTWVRK